MLTRQAGGWGLGVDLGQPGKEPQFGHSGTNPGYQSYFVYFSQRRRGLALMTNGASQSGFMMEIAGAVARAYGWLGFDTVLRDAAPVDPAVLKRYAGEWLADGAPPFQIMVDQDHLTIVDGPFGPKPVRLYAASPTRFFVLSTGFTFQFDEATPDKAVLAGGIRAARIRR